MITSINFSLNSIAVTHYLLTACVKKRAYNVAKSCIVPKFTAFLIHCIQFV